MVDPFTISHCSQCSTTGLTRKEMFYLTMHSTHCIYGYMASEWMVAQMNGQTNKKKIE